MHKRAIPPREFKFVNISATSAQSLPRRAKWALYANTLEIPIGLELFLRTMVLSLHLEDRPHKPSSLCKSRSRSSNVFPVRAELMDEKEWDLYTCGGVIRPV